MALGTPGASLTHLEWSPSLAIVTGREGLRQAPRPNLAHLAGIIRRDVAARGPCLSDPGAKFSRPAMAAAEAERPARAGRHERGAAAAAPQAPLGNPGRNASAAGQETPQQRRRALRRLLWQISPGTWPGKCGRVLQGGGSVLVRKSGGQSRYANLMTCGSIHCCPVCQTAKRTEKAEQVSKLAAWWIDEGHGLMMVTLTFPHHLGMPLAGLWKMVADGLRFTRSGRPYQRIKAAVGIVHSVRALEVTVGYNGWHPHVHLLLLLDTPPQAAELATVKIYFDRRWGGWVRRRGYGELDPVHGVVVTPCYTRADVLGGYVAKLQEGWSLGREMTSADAKRGRAGHRTPLQVLDGYGETGSDADLRLWREWEAAAPGHQAVVLSDGLADLAALAELDAELADADAGDQAEDVDVALIPYESTWKAITADGRLYEAVLAAADAAGLAGINGVLSAAGLQLAGPVPLDWRDDRQRWQAGWQP